MSPATPAIYPYGHPRSLHVALPVSRGWNDERAGAQVADPAAQGDVVLARKDAPAGYHLAVTLDDAAQGVTHVVRGQDLFVATHVHRLLQALLGLPTPVYHHQDRKSTRLNSSH